MSALATVPIAPTATPLPSRVVHSGHAPVETGEPIELADLSGRILFDDFEDVFAMDVDGSTVGLHLRAGRLYVSADGRGVLARRAR
jgi:hypothetical protein